MDKLKHKATAESERNVEKLRRKAILEEEKTEKTGRVSEVQFVKAIIDQDLVAETLGSRILSNLATLNLNYELEPQSIGRVIFWQRSHQQTIVSSGDGVQLTDKYTDEEHLLHIMPAAELNGYVKENELLQRVKLIQCLYPNKQITLLVFGLKEFCRKNRSNVGRMASERALTEIQLMANVSHRLLDTAEDIGNTVMQFSKSIAEIPYKKDCADKASQQNFYIANDKKDCIQVKGEIGLKNLWQRHLTKFPQVTLETAEAIIEKYAMPSKLIEAYDCSDTNGPLLLADIPIRRAAGSAGMSAARKIGTELSKKIHAFYTNSNLDYIL